MGLLLPLKRSTLICPYCQNVKPSGRPAYDTPSPRHTSKDCRSPCVKLPQKVTILSPPKPTMSDFDVQQSNKHSHFIIIAHIYDLLLTFALFMFFSKATGANVLIYCVHSLLVVLIQGCSYSDATYHSFYRVF